MEIDDNTEPEKSSSPGISAKQSFVASPGHDGEDALRRLAPP